MTNRPSIPISIQREILIEAGHRCAVCGAAFPLEKAHIVPWCKTNDHSAHNLICLCANCHEMADKDWDEMTLRAYKLSPWISRYTKPVKIKQSKTISITIKLDVPISEFEEKNKRYLIYGLAGFLEVKPTQIEIDGIIEGSTIVQFSIPEILITRIEKVLNSSFYEIQKYFELFPIKNIKIEDVINYKFSVEDILIILENYFGLTNTFIANRIKLFLQNNLIENSDANCFSDFKQLLLTSNPNLLPVSFDLLKDIFDYKIVVCPRCHGKGWVTAEDIIFFRMQSYWRPGICRYCFSNGYLPIHLTLLKGVTEPPP